MSTKHSLLPAIAASTALLVLAGCGGGGGGGSGDDPQPGGAPTAQTGAAPAAPSDAFVTQIEAVLADTSDTAEPRDIGSYQATTPENTEPVPLT